MTETDRNQLSSSQRILLALKQARLQLEAIEQQKNEPIAIVGMDCRFPGGANNPAAYWQLLRNGVDAITEVPTQRWELEAYYDSNPEAEGKMYTRYGGFIEEVDQFDPEFFAISPREAISLDPQQRLLLEVSYTALEQAGQSPEQLKGSQTGVFIGINFDDYARRSLTSGDPTLIDAYSSLGNTRSIAVGRIAYILGLQGPVIQLDTACSSSLLAVHLACQSLRLKECNLALAGGVNLILSPEPTIGFCKLKALASDGRCKTFDAQANGYGRGEGCGIVVLKRLSDAIANQDNILALIVGSAVNHDGQSNGLTAPNGSAQEAVIRQALLNAKVEAAQIQYVETHGTGTELGDPIEVLALGKVLSESRTKDNLLYIGSVKTNFGHLESAAGIASLIKVILSLQHQKIPPHLHFKTPNPYIPWQKLPITVPTQLTPWTSGNEKRLAGISSFGMSGTNVHVIVSEAKKDKREEAIGNGELNLERPLHLLTLSAKNEQALRDLAQSYENFVLSNPKVSLKNVCFTANTGRSHFEHRLAIIAETAPQVCEQLKAFTQDLETFERFKGIVSPHKQSKIAFLFTGQGSQYSGMAQQLYQTQPTFRQNLDRCAEILQPYLDQSLLDILYPAKHKDVNLLDETVYTQPALFALEYSLAQLWISWGIMPSVVIGHSIGEYVAACIAGVFSLEDGLKLVAYRGRLMQKLHKDGAMVAVKASQEKVESVIKAYENDIAIAAINSDDNIVISGKNKAIKQIIIDLEQEGIKTTRLKVSHAFHSPLMKPMLTDFAEVTESISYSAPKLPIVSNVSGTIAGDEIATPQYWCHHVCQPVKFYEGMLTITAQNCRIFLEIGAKPTLLGIGQSILKNQNQQDYLLLPSLTFGQFDWQIMLSSVAALYVNGIKINWSVFEKNSACQRICLPTYPFQKQTYWLEPPGLKISFIKNKNRHPLLGQELNLAGANAFYFENKINQDSPAFLKDHRIFETVIFPAAGFLEMALAAGKFVFPQEEFILESVNIFQALVLLPEEIKRVQLKILTESSQIYNFEIYSLTNLKTNDIDKINNWTLHTKGKIVKSKEITQPYTIDLKKEKSQLNKTILADEHYQDYLKHNIYYGKSFQIIKHIGKSQNQALGEIEFLDLDLDLDSNYQIHPILLDACLQLAGSLLSDKDNNLQTVYLPVGLEKITIHSNFKQKQNSNRFYAYAQISSFNRLNLVNNKKLIFDIQLLAEDGEEIAVLEGLQLKQTNSQALLGIEKISLQDWLYEVEWQLKTENKLFLNNSLLSPDAIYSHLIPKFTQLTTQPQLKAYLEILPQLETISFAYILQTFIQLRWKFEHKTTFSTTQLAEQLGIIESHHRLLNRILEILAEEGILKQLDREWQVIQTSSLHNSTFPEKHLQTIENLASAEINLLKRCGSNLALVLKGECDPIQLLFQDGDLSILTELYQNSPVAKLINTLAQEAVLKVLDKKLPEQKIKILEIGAGTGGTTSYLLPHLNAHETEYTFTDISALFTTKAQEKFKEYSFVKYRLLDIETNPQTQGFNWQDYDIIIAANVLHATQDLQQTLAYIKQLLASEGILILLEGTRPLRWLDLIFGLTEGWWRFTDTHLRSSHPLISAQQWKNLLRTSGFKQVIDITLEQSIIIAQNEAITPKNQNKSWLIFADTQGIAEELAKHLTAKGHACNLVLVGETYQQLEKHKYYINPGNLANFQQLFTHTKIDEIIYLWSLDAPETKKLDVDLLTATSKTLCESTLYLIQSLLKKISELNKLKLIAPRLWLVTRGTISIEDNDNISGLAQAPLWGLGKSITLEHPDIKCIRIDLDSQAQQKEQIQTLLTEIELDSKEDKIAYRHSKRYVPRLTRSPQKLEKNQLAFLTAYYTLHHLARMQKGERVLIHCAASDVGLAAVQIAQQAEVEILATAHPSQWKTIKSWGVKQIMNSDTLDFAEQIRAITQNQGVDIVLNSLSGDFIATSLSILKDKGRFINIGKEGVWTSEEVYQFKPNITYFPVDIITIAQQQPGSILSMLMDLKQRFQDKIIKPLPNNIFSLEQALKIFQDLEKLKHINKIVIFQEPTKQLTFEGTYLITGGFGGLGLLVADWLIKQGVRYLVLVGRNDPNTNALKRIHQLEKLGAGILIKKADVAQEKQLAEVIKQIQKSQLTFPSLRGVIHAAGVLDDGIIEQLDWKRFEKVMTPKVQGAWNLHTLTKHIPLECFVLFSSATALLGSPGQANHVAANTFLDTLAQYRQSQGLPALSINWGVWSEIGAAAQRQVEIEGIGKISPQNGLKLLEQLIHSSSSQVGVIPINWPVLLEKQITSPFFANFSHITKENQKEKSNFLQVLQATSPENRQAKLITYIRSEVANVLGFHPSKIDIEKGFFDLGMDSLTSMELKNRLQNNLKCSLSSTLAFNYPTVVALADYLLKEVLDLGVNNLEEKNHLAAKSERLANLAELSQDDIADLLSQELLEIERGKK